MVCRSIFLEKKRMLLAQLRSEKFGTLGKSDMFKYQNKIHIYNRKILLPPIGNKCR
jgi:hypothetical protein